MGFGFFVGGNKSVFVLNTVFVNLLFRLVQLKGFIMKLIALISLSLFILACSSTPNKTGWSNPSSPAMYAAFSHKVGEITGVTHSRRSQISRRADCLFDLNTDEVLHCDKTYARNCIDNLGLANYKFNDGAWKVYTGDRCEAASQLKTTSRSPEARGFIAWIAVIPLVLGQMRWEITTDMDKVHDLYAQSKNKLDFDKISKEVAFAKKNENEVKLKFEQEKRQYDASISKLVSSINNKSTIALGYLQKKIIRNNVTDFTDAPNIDSVCLADSQVQPLELTQASLKYFDNTHLMAYTENSEGYIQNLRKVLNSEPRIYLQQSGFFEEEIEGYKYQIRCTLAGNKITSFTKVLGKYLTPSFYQINQSNQHLESEYRNAILNLTNKTNKYIKLKGYSIYHDDEIRTTSYDSELLIPPLGVKQINIQKTLKAFEIERYRFYSYAKVAPVQIGFAVSYEVDGSELSLFKAEATAIAYE